MTTPTLELNLKATGVKDVKDLTAALEALDSMVGRLGKQTQTSAFSQLTDEMRGLRSELKTGFAEIGKLMASGMADSYKQAQKAAQAGSKDLQKTFDDNMRSVINNISKSNEEIARKLTEANGKVALQAKAAGQQAGLQFAEGVQQGAAKVRISAGTISMGNGVKASVSASGIGNLAEAEATLAKLKETSRAQDALMAEQATAMNQAVTIFRRMKEQQLSDQISFEDKQKARWVEYNRTLQARLNEEKSMMTQAVTTFRRLQQEKADALVSSARSQVLKATNTPTGAYSSLGASSYGALTNLPKDLEEVESKGVRAAKAVSSLAGELTGAHSAARGLASGFGLMWLSWGQILPLLAGAAISHSFAEVVHMGAQVQHTFEIIRVLSVETSESIGSLNNQMISLARTGPFGPLEIAEAMKTLSLAGLDAKEVGSSIKDVLNFAVAGTTSIKDSADVLTSVATAFKISADGFNYVGDVIAKTAAISKSSVESVGQSFKMASVINAQYGASLEDVGTGLALLSNLGIQGTAAGTALRNFYVDIMGRAPKVRQALKELGVDASDAAGKAKPLVDIVGQLAKGLSQFDGKAQFRLLQDVFSERGGKEGIALLTALRTQADKTKTDVATVLEDIKKQLDNAAGFMAVSAATLALTPLNQMKSVLSNLQTTLVEAFDGLQPYILRTAAELKEIFSSPEFQNSVQKLVMAFAYLTEGLVKHLDVVALLAAAWIGLKIGNTVVSIVTTLTERFGIYTTAAAAATAQTAALAAAQEAEAVAAGGAAAAAARKASTVGLLIGTFTKLLPWIGAAVTAWQLYSFWTDKSAASNTKIVGPQADALIEALRTEADRLEDINRAKATGISLDELKRNNATRQAVDAVDAPAKAAQAELERMQAREQAARGANSTNPTLAYRNLQLQIDKQSLEVDRLRSVAANERFKIELETLRIQQAAEIGKKNALAVAATKGQATYGENGLPDHSGDLKGPGGNAALAAAKSDMQAQEAMLKTSYDNRMKLLDELHRGQLISEGAYQAQQIAATQAYEDHMREVIVAGSREEALAYQAKAEAILSKDKGEKQKKALEDLGLQWHNYANGVIKDLNALDSNAQKRMQSSTIAEAAEVNKFLKANTEYWVKADAGVKKEEAAVQARKDLTGASDQARASAEAAAKTYESFGAQIEKLQLQYDTAKAALDEFDKAQESTVDFTPEILNAYSNMEDSVKAYAKALSDAKSKAKELSDRSGDAAAIDAYNKADQKLRDEFATSSKQISGTLADAILQGGKDGGASLKSWFKTNFILNPIKVFLQAVMSPIGNIGAGLLQSLGPGNQSGTAAGQLGGLGSFGSLIPGLGLGGGSMFSAMAGATMQNGLIGGFGANMANIGTALGGGDLLGAAGALGPYAAVAALAFTLYKSLKGGETRSGGQYKNGVFIGGPSGGEIGTTAADAAKTTQDAINTMLKSLGSTLQTNYFVTGLESSKEGKGFAYAGGALSNGTVFGQGVDGLGYNNRRGNMTEEEASTAYQAELEQASLEALKAAAGTIPQIVTDMLKDKDISSMTDDARKTLLADINTISVGITSFDAVVRLLPMAYLKNLSADLKASLVSMAGGFEQLNTNLQAYYENFYTVEEKRANVVSNITTALTDSGLALAQISTMLADSTSADDARKMFRALTESIDVTTDAGKKEFSALIGVSSAFASITQSATSFTDVVTASNPLVENLTKAKANLVSAYQREISTLTSLATRMRSFAVDLMSFKDSLLMDDTLSPLTPGEQYATSRAQLEEIWAKAQTGDETALGKLQGAIQTFLQASRGYNASNEQYTTDFSWVQDLLTQASALATTQADAADAQAAILQDQLGVLGEIADNTQTIGEAFAAYSQAVVDAVKGGVDVTGDPGGLAALLSAILVNSDALALLTQQSGEGFGQLVSALASVPGVLEAIPASIWAIPGTLQSVFASLFGAGSNFSQIPIALMQVPGALAALTAAITTLGRTGLMEITNGVTGQMVNSPIGQVYNSTAGMSYYGGQLYTPVGTFAVELARGYIQNLVSNGQFLDAYNAIKAVGMTLLESDVLMGWTPGTASAAAVAGGLPVFAKGGAFTHGIVTRPTMFNMGMMGEGGNSEAIMPLTSVNGSLGVRAIMPSGGGDKEIVKRLDMLTAQQAQGTRALIQSNFEANERGANKIVTGTNTHRTRAAWEQKMAQQAQRKH